MRLSVAITRALALALLGCGGGAGPATDGGARPDGAVDEREGGAPPAPAWRPVLEELDGALLSVWGSSARDVWAVGGSLGNGAPALVVRFDGAVWRRARPGKSESFWWVHGTGERDVWLVGERGRITHWDGTAFEEHASGTAATLFGVWSARPDEAWAVGGTPESATDANDVLLRWDGSSWKPEALPEPSTPARGVALYKVWGPPPRDGEPSELYVVGEAGVIWHRVQNAWKREGVGVATGRLTTVFGCSATEVYAVGGRDLLVSDGTTWRRAEIDPLLVVNDLNGVSCGPGGVVIVGGGSLKLRLARRADGSRVWTSDFGSEPLVDLHGAWADPSGAFWGVGGQFNAAPRPGALRSGAVARYALDVIPGILEP